MLTANDTYNYAVSGIPEGLSENANAIMRYYEREIEIINSSAYLHKERYAITILNGKGKLYDRLYEVYGELIKIKKISGVLYDSTGKVIKKMKLKDATDVSSYISSAVFHDDIRFKMYDFNCLQYPYTVAFDIETEYTTFLMPDWIVQPGNDIAIEKTTFTVKCPKELSLRYREYLMPGGTLLHSEADNRIVWQWQIVEYKASKYQPYSIIGNYSVPAVAIAPGFFQLKQFKGDMSSWKSFSSFLYEMNAERDQLPSEHKTFIHKLTEGFVTDQEKINAIYEYMQQNLRYVAIEYGISGWQTYDAASVVKTGYGDCKGLTNYMKAALNEIGISSYAALVNAGEDYYKLDESFPSNRFNHVILCIPTDEDTIWVECTSQYLSLGYLSAFTQDRNVLLIKKEGGELCRTPKYYKQNNATHRKIQITYDPAQEDQFLRIQGSYSGMASDNIIQFVRSSSEKDIREQRSEKYGFQSAAVSEYKQNIQFSQFIPTFHETISLKVKGLFNNTQRRVFVNTTWYSNPMNKIEQEGKRTAPIVIEKQMLMVDTIQIDLPREIAIESLPTSFKDTFPFASVSLDVKSLNDKIIIIRIFEQEEGVYDANEFENYQKIYTTMEKMNSKMKIVLNRI